MFLSRLVLSRRNRQVRRDLADCDGLHKTVLRAFPEVPEAQGPARSRLGVLHRVDEDPRTGELVLYVQSCVEPRWDGLPDGWASRAETKSLDDAFAALEAGSVLSFRLRANATKRLGRKAQGRLGPGKRVALVREDDQLAWLARKAKALGFELVELAVERPPVDFFDGSITVPHDEEPRKAVVDVRATPESAARSGDRLTLGSVVFDGRLRITDAERFRETLARGIGSGKAYGFGLLSVARPR